MGHQVWPGMRALVSLASNSRADRGRLGTRASVRGADGTLGVRVRLAPSGGIGTALLARGVSGQDGNNLVVTVKRTLRPLGPSDAFSGCSNPWTIA